MAFVEFTDLPAHLPPQGALFGLDLGEKTIGIAVSDPTRIISSPLKTLEKTKFSKDAAELFKLMDARAAVGLVIGLPVNMDGSEGTRCQSNRAFARNLLRLRDDLVIAFWDERLSTVAVNRVLIDEFDASRAKRADLVDQMAAGWILQGALERLRNL